MKILTPKLVLESARGSSSRGGGIFGGMPPPPGNFYFEKALGRALCVF